jgi:LPS-assembly protein
LEPALEPDSHSIPHLQNWLTRAAIVLFLLFFPLAGSLANEAETEGSDNIVSEEVSEPGETANLNYSNLDWVPEAELKKGQLKGIRNGCCGRFIDPLADSPPESEDKAITLTGEESHMTEAETVVTGNVVITQGNVVLTGDQASYNRESGKARVEGHVTVRKPGVLIRGDHADAAVSEDYVIVSDARYVFHNEQIHGSASLVERDKEGVVTLNDATYTTCSPENITWLIKTRELELDPNTRQGKARHTTLRWKGIPVLYVPYLRFPLGKERMSGFLAPSFEHTEDGFGFSIPYYFDLAPNYDATLEFRNVAERGPEVSTEFRYLTDLFSGELQTSILPNDDEYNDDRWLFGFHTRGGSRRPWTVKANYTRVSDDEYFNDLDNTLLNLARRTHVKQHFYGDYATDHWLLSLETLQFQTLRDTRLNDPYQKLPTMEARGAYVFGPMETSFWNQLTQFDHRSSRQTTGERYAGDQALTWRLKNDYGFIHPSVRLRHTHQQLDIPLASDYDKSVYVPSASLDMGLFLDKQTSKRHLTLEPRLKYYFSDYENQSRLNLFDTDEFRFDYDQVFRETRFSGPDRIDDANQVSLGLTHRILEPDFGREIFSLSVGQIYYQRDREVTAFTPAEYRNLSREYRERYMQNQSPIAVQLRYWFNEIWSFTGDYSWNPDTDRSVNGSAYAHIKLDDTVMSLGFQKTDILRRTGFTTFAEEHIEEVDFSTHYQITPQWGIFGRYRYDLVRNRDLQTYGGVEYDGCCWKAKLALRRWAVNSDLDPDEAENGIFLEVEFKSLGSFGDKIDTINRSNIRGYAK